MEIRRALIAFRANNELALHVADPAVAAEFYEDVLGGAIVSRTPDCIEVASGALRLFLLRDPAPTHDVIVPSFDVADRAAALAHLEASGCSLVPIGPHAPDGHYVRDPSGVIFDIIERPSMTDEHSEASLRACETALREAQLTSDVQELDRLVDDALVFTGPNGAVYTKEDDLDAHRRGVIRITRLDPSEERILRFGHIAVVSVRMEMSGTFEGAPFAGPFRYTRVWRAHEDSWRIVAGHVSAVVV